MSETSDTTIKRWPAKHPGAKLQYGFNLEPECARRWTENTDFAAGTRIRVYGLRNGAAGGYEFEYSGGRTGGKEPVWPSTIAATVADGSGTWTCRALSSSSLIRTVSGTPAWSADSGLIITGVSINGMVATAYIDGGTDGNDYLVTITATMSDETVPLVCTLPVSIAGGQVC